MGGKKGDHIVVESEAVGTPTREGEILEVISGTVAVRYRVRWEDGHESTFTPSGGSARIEPRAAKRPPAAKSTPAEKRTPKKK